MSTLKPLTEKQKRVARFIRDFAEEVGYAPSIRDLCEILGITINAVNDHLRFMERKGCLARDKRVARSMRLTPLGLEQIQ